MAADGYLTIAAPVRSEIIIERSRFLTFLLPVQSDEAARGIVAAEKKEYHDAAHVCYAYRTEGGAERFSDAGEPQGTAGQPMLEVLKKQNLINILAVTVRWFGGIKLGAGGLTRAYSQGVSEAVYLAEKVEMKRCFTVRFNLNFSAYQSFLSRRAALKCVAVARDFAEAVTCTEGVLPPDLEAFKGVIRDVSGGAAEVSVTGEGYFAFKPEQL